MTPTPPLPPSPPPTAPHLRLGRAGEAAAEALLAGKGFAVLARNYRTRGGEVDLVCQDGGTLVFVEVKTRGAGSLARPDQAVTAAKRGRLVRAAAAFLSERDLWDRPCRFDVVAVVASGKALTATHLPDAFVLEDGMGTGNFYQPG
jgi:putative endonuclease